MATAPIPLRSRRASDGDTPIPLNAVWELTMRCDQACAHCGSRAAKPRADELDTEEVLAVGRALQRLGCREVSLIGGEAYLRPDIETIVSSLAETGMRVVMQTGGRNFDVERARRLRDAGLSAVGVSVDGLALTHDKLRGNLGSFRAAIRALDAGREMGLITTANSQINKLNMGELRELCALLRSKEIQSWQVQLTVAMGRAADRPEWIVAPSDVVDIIDTLAALQLEAVAECPPDELPFHIIGGNNLGYFGPHELALRSRPRGTAAHWGGCKAGIDVIGLESDGTIKACPSLPTAPYVGGNVRELSLEEIWEHGERMRFTRDRTADELWGFCATCHYADDCRAGCSWTAHCTLGRRGNNPFCYHRVVQLRKKGVREVLRAVERPPNQPYDFGRFELVEEPC